MFHVSCFVCHFIANDESSFQENTVTFFPEKNNNKEKATTTKIHLSLTASSWNRSSFFRFNDRLCTVFSVVAHTVASWKGSSTGKPLSVHGVYAKTRTFTFPVNGKSEAD